MRKLAAFLILISMIGITACSKVPAGFVGVKVYLLGKEKGVDTEILTTGRYWIGMNEELYLFPTYKVTKTWNRDIDEDTPANEEFSLQTREGMIVTADVGMIYQIDPAKANALFQEFRKGADEITHVYLRGYIRDKLTKYASQYEVTDIYGPKKIEIIERAEREAREELSPKGILIDKLYWIGAIRLPKNVQDALDSKIEATQRAMQRENEVQEARAQAEKKIAEARGEAESLRLKANTLTSQNLEFERLQVQRLAIEKWNGQLPAQMIPGAAVPFVRLDSH